jgi:hypothetical protein
LLVHGAFEQALEAWLTRLDVRRLSTTDTAISLRKDGMTRVTNANFTVEGEQAVLAGDDAIMRYLPADGLDRSLERFPASAALLEGARLSSPLAVYLDRGVSLLQEPRSTSLAALTVGNAETARPRLGSALSRLGALRLAGETVVPTLRTSDGAPFVGLARGVRATVIAGLGGPGAFYAPVLARHLAGRAAPHEEAWIAARGATRGNLRLNVSDYAMVPA